jgi:1,4-dihydroxy-2-naphthoyl-CoA synthase
MDDQQAVLIEKRGHALWITLNRPERRNAINRDILLGVRQGYEQAHDDPEVRVIILTGAGEKAFCAGADLAPGGAFEFDYSKPSNDYADLLRLGRQSTIPSIARINGLCMAGGMGFLCMADLAVASDTALFALPEVKIGVFPMQVLALLQDMVAPRIVREWCLTGEVFSAQTALAHGLINYCVAPSELDATTNRLVESLADKSPSAIRLGKYALRAMAGMSFDEALMHAQGQIVIMAQTNDAKEGFAAFNEKRKPKWGERSK